MVKKCICGVVVCSLVAVAGIELYNNIKHKNTNDSDKVVEKTVEYKNDSKNCSYTSKITVSRSKKLKLSSSDMKMLSCLVYAEAGNEPYTGQIAVANVVVNRMRSKSFPNSVKGVISQKFQFGPYRNGALSREVRKYSNGKYKSGSRAKTVRAVKEALNGKNVVGKRKSFNSARVEIRRSHKNALRIKNHLFW